MTKKETDKYIDACVVRVNEIRRINIMSDHIVDRAVISSMIMDADAYIEAIDYTRCTDTNDAEFFVKCNDFENHMIDINKYIT